VLKNYRGWRTRKCESYGTEEGESESRKNAKKTAKIEEKEFRKLRKKSEV